MLNNNLEVKLAGKLDNQTMQKYVAYLQTQGDANGFFVLSKAEQEKRVLDWLSNQSLFEINPDSAPFDLGIKGVEYKNFKTKADNAKQGVSIEKNTSSENSAITILDKMLSSAQANMQYQQKADGDIADFVNGVKEFFNAEKAKSNVNEALKQEANSLQTLKKASDGELEKLEAPTGQTVPVSFKQAFKQERGVEFKTENIEKFQSTAEEFNKVSAIKNTCDSYHEKLNTAIKAFDTLDTHAYAKTSGAYIQSANTQEKGYLESLSDLYQKDFNKMKLHVENSAAQEGKDNLTLFNDNGVLRIVDKKDVKDGELQLKNYYNYRDDETINKMAKKLLNSVDAQYKNVFKDKKFKEYEKEYKTAYSQAFGEKNIEELSKAYMKSQETGVQYTKMGVIISAAIAAPFTGGGTLAVVGASMGASAAMDLVEYSTDADGLTKEEGIQTAKSAAETGAFTFTGMQASKLGQFVKGSIKGAEIAAETTGISAKAINVAATTAGITTEIAGDTAFTLALQGGDTLEVAKTMTGFNLTMMAIGGVAQKIIKIKTPKDIDFKALEESGIKLDAQQQEALISEMTKTVKNATEESPFSAKVELDELKLIKNEDLKYIAKNTKHSSGYIEEIYYKLENITDENIQKFVQNEIEELKHNIKSSKNPEAYIDRLDKIDKLDQLLDAYNSSQGHYTYYGSYFGQSNPAEYYNYIKQHSPNNAKALLNKMNSKFNTKFIDFNNINWNKAQRTFANEMIDDFINAQKFENLKSYTMKHPNCEMSKYLYENHYLTTLPKKIQSQCKELNNQFGTKLYFSADKFSMESAIQNISDELTAWKNASNGKAQLPPVIDLNRIQKSYLDGNEGSGHAITGSIEINGNSTNVINEALRHEITHTNDLKFQGLDNTNKYDLNEIMPKKTIRIGPMTRKVIDYDNCKYKNEFENAGIPKDRIERAHHDTKEFIAVAMEGDVSAYSDEFKQVLFDFGLPEWALKLDKTGNKIKTDLLSSSNTPKQKPIILMNMPAGKAKQTSLPKDYVVMGTDAPSVQNINLSLAEKGKLLFDKKTLHEAKVEKQQRFVNEHNARKYVQKNIGEYYDYITEKMKIESPQMQSKGTYSSMKFSDGTIVRREYNPMIKGDANSPSEIFLLITPDKETFLLPANSGKNVVSADKIVNYMEKTPIVQKSTIQTEQMFDAYRKKFNLDIDDATCKTIYENVDKLYKQTTQLSGEIIDDFNNTFGKIEGVSTSARVKNEGTLHEKAYRKYKSMSNNIEKHQKEYNELQSYLDTKEQMRSINVDEIKQRQTYLTEEINKTTIAMEKLKSDFNGIKERLDDALGQRVIFENTSPEVVEQAVQTMVKDIEDGKYIIIELENYGAGDDYFYFNQNQVDRLATACLAKGHKMEYKPKNKESGYTTAQFNLEYKNGVISEMQFRGRKIHDLAESEHLLYDMREGKDIAKGNKEVEKLLEPIYTAQKELLDADPVLKKEYENYLAVEYNRARRNEIEPSFYDKQELPPDIPEVLDIDNIIDVHNKLVKLTASN